MEPLRRSILPELVGEPETLLIDSTLLEVLRALFPCRGCLAAARDAADPRNGLLRTGFAVPVQES
jgi:hypothetical protein